MLGQEDPCKLLNKYSLQALDIINQGSLFIHNNITLYFCQVNNLLDMKKIFVK